MENNNSKSPATRSGWLSSFLAAVAMSSIVIVVGVLLSFIIIGIPILIVGIFMLILSPFANRIIVDGECPLCYTKVTMMKGKSGADCKGCKCRLLYREGYIVLAPKAI